MQMQDVKYYDSSLWVPNTYDAWEIEEFNKTLLINCNGKFLTAQSPDEDLLHAGFTVGDFCVTTYDILEQADSLSATLWTKLEIKDLM